MNKVKCIFFIFSFFTSIYSLKAQYPNPLKKITVYTTAQNTDMRLSKGGTLVFTNLQMPPEKESCVFIDPSKKFQTLLGIGGALTDASAEVFAKLSKETQQELLTAYYDRIKGIGYTLARTNMNSCDFSSDSYSYVNDGDVKLSTFNIAHDKTFKLPLIKQAIKAAGGRLTIFFSPWSPPAWMKNNNNMLHGGELLTQYRQTWANYFAKFIKAYAAQGINFWGLTVQNEPMAQQTWESCVFSADKERDFVKNYLGPTLEKQGLANKKIVIWDHNRDYMHQYAGTILNDPLAAKYIWGVGYHWYEPWKGGDMQFANEQKIAESFPNKNLLFTEGCNGDFDIKKLNNWENGERYGYSMINDFNFGTVGWTDWNILLDEHGGPNHIGNYCFAPVHADTKTGKLTYTSAYYYLGHFSKFIRPGARRVAASSGQDQLFATAFINPDKTLVVVVMNKSDKKAAYHLWITNKAADVQALPHSISTYVIE
jgi:glucosylceramidase